MQLQASSLTKDLRDLNLLKILDGEITDVANKRHETLYEELEAYFIIIGIATLLIMILFSFIGIEKDPLNFDIACHRLAELYAPNQMASASKISAIHERVTSL